MVRWGCNSPVYKGCHSEVGPRVLRSREVLELEGRVQSHNHVTLNSEVTMRSRTHGRNLKKRPGLLNCSIDSDVYSILGLQL